MSPETTLLQTRTRRALRRTPLWLGRIFAGQPLQSIAVGAELLEGPSGARLSAAPFVRYDYGAFSLQEFGAKHPSWYREGPEPGHVILERGQRAVVSRDGVLVLINPSSLPGFFPTLTRSRILRLIGALRPVPG